MDCQGIITELRAALKKDDDTLRETVKRIVRKYGKHTGKKADFELKKGRTYMLNEKKPRTIRAIFNQVVEKGLPGLYITRENPEELHFSSFDNVKILWLSSIPGRSRVDPTDLTKMHSVISEFMENSEGSIVGFEGIETVITSTDFKKTLKLIQRVRDMAVEKHSIFILSVDPDTLGDKEMALIEKEVNERIPVKKFRR